MENLKTGKSPGDVYSSLTKVGNDPNSVAQLYTQLPRLKRSRRAETIFRTCEALAVLFITCALIYCYVNLRILMDEVENLKERINAGKEQSGIEDWRNIQIAPKTDRDDFEASLFRHLITTNMDESSGEEEPSPFKRKREITAWYGHTSERTLESKESAASTKSFSSEEYSSEPSINVESSSPRNRKRRKGLRKPKKYHRHSVSAEKFYSGVESTTAVPIQIRQSRTKQTAGFETVKHKRVLDHKPLLQVYGSKDYITREEALRWPNGLRNLKPEHVEIGKRHKFGNASQIDLSTSKELAESVTYNMIMIHYAADTSHYSKERDSNYCGNGRMQMKDSVYKDWKAAHSTQGVDITKFFSLSRGEVTVSVTGIYLIYAQVQYSNLQEVNGYEVIRNKQTVVQCITTSVHPDKHEIKSNTCDTSTTILLYAGDKIFLQDLHHGRHVVLKPEKSYFGLILLSPFKENNNLL